MDTKNTVSAGTKKADVKNNNIKALKNVSKIGYAITTELSTKANEVREERAKFLTNDQIGVRRAELGSAGMLFDTHAKKAAVFGSLPAATHETFKLFGLDPKVILQPTNNGGLAREGKKNLNGWLCAQTYGSYYEIPFYEISQAIKKCDPKFAAFTKIDASTQHYLYELTFKDQVNYDDLLPLRGTTQSDYFFGLFNKLNAYGCNIGQVFGSKSNRYLKVNVDHPVIIDLRKKMIPFYNKVNFNPIQTKG